MPVSASNLSSQDYQFKVVTPQGVWRWTTRVDLSLANPCYLVRDIITPYGLLRDSVPLPGAVIQEMADSITLLQQQFAPAILLSPTTLSFIVDQGRGFGLPQTVMVTNNGVFGSLLGVSLTSSVPYVSTSAPSLGGIPSNGVGSFEVMVDSTNLVAFNSPYAATISIQDPAAVNNPQTIAVAIVVRPLAIITLTPSFPTVLNFVATQPFSGPFATVSPQVFTVTNTGPTGSSLDYQIQKLTDCSPWLASFTPPLGTLSSGGSQNTSVVVQPLQGMGTGSYTETLRVSGYSQNSYQDVVVNLVIS